MWVLFQNSLYNANSFYLILQFNNCHILAVSKKFALCSEFSKFGTLFHTVLRTGTNKWVNVRGTKSGSFGILKENGSIKVLLIQAKRRHSVFTAWKLRYHRGYEKTWKKLKLSKRNFGKNSSPQSREQFFMVYSRIIIHHINLF